MVKFLKTNIKIKPLEVVLFVLFIFYLVFQIKTPKFLSSYIDTTIGVVVILFFTLYLFLYTNPVLGILSVLVAYELIRRSGQVYNKELPNDLISPSSTYLTDFSRSLNKENTTAHNIISTPEKASLGNIGVERSQITHEYPVVTLMPKGENTLEEEVVSQMAPIGGSNASDYIVSEFKPISENTHDADRF